MTSDLLDCFVFGRWTCDLGTGCLLMSTQLRLLRDIGWIRSKEKFQKSLKELISGVSVAIKAGLIGCCVIRNGPGDFNFLNEPVTNPYDANGIIGSIAIKDGRAFFRSRYVKTKELTHDFCLLIRVWIVE